VVRCRRTGKPAYFFFATLAGFAAGVGAVSDFARINWSRRALISPMIFALCAVSLAIVALILAMSFAVWETGAAFFAAGFAAGFATAFTTGFATGFAVAFEAAGFTDFDAALGAAFFVAVAMIIPF